MTEFTNSTILVTGVTLGEAKERANIILQEKVIPRQESYLQYKAGLNKEPSKNKMKENPLG